MVSTNSVDFGNVQVGQSSTRTITLSNDSGYNVGISGDITISNAFLTGSTSNCGSSLANGGTCTISVKFTPSAAGLISGQVQIPFVSATSPYSIALKGTGVVAAAPVAPVAPVTPAQPTHVTKPMPASCISYIGGSTLEVPYFTFNGTPMWGKFTSTGSLVAYKLSDYGALTGTASSTCVADGGKLGITTNAATICSMAIILTPPRCNWWVWISMDFSYSTSLPPMFTKPPAITIQTSIRATSTTAFWWAIGHCITA
jgi:hypothetical protein